MLKIIRQTKQNIYYFQRIANLFQTKQNKIKKTNILEVEMKKKGNWKNIPIFY